MTSLGTPPMPWQQHCLDIIGEVDATGNYRWPIVIISVPRQSGKTTMTMAVALHRILTGRGRKAWHTAQTGQDARRKWLELADVAMRSPWQSILKTRKTNGAESLEIPRLMSKFSPHPPTQESLHGEQSDLNIIDEAWAFDDAQGEALMQAIVPTQTTRRGAQTIMVSTMGTANSTWFHRKVEQARAGAQDIAIVEWGIGPDDDPTDLDVVAACHPAYGYTVNMRSLERAAAQLGPAQFARAYGNRPTGAIERVIPLEAWQAAASHEDIPLDAPVAFAAAVDFDRTQTAIAAAAIIDDTPMIEIVDVRPGTAWAAPRLSELVERHESTAVVVDHVGPSGALYDELDRSGMDELLRITSHDLTGACADFYDRVTGDIDENGVRQARIKIRPNSHLDLAAEIVTKRRVGDAWAWSRRDTTGSTGTMAPLEAATLAMFAAHHQPPPSALPDIF